jgi:hypothetical protein
MRNNIAGIKIPCKPQKLQGIFATVEIRRGIWHHGPIVEQAWIGRKNGHWQGVELAPPSG